jgi:hypothetical protein
MSARALDSLEILKSTEVDIAHENHHATLVGLVRSSDIEELFRLVPIAHCDDSGLCRDQRTNDIHHGIKARNDVSRPNELRTALRQVIQMAGTCTHTNDHTFCPGRR